MDDQLLNAGYDQPQQQLQPYNQFPPAGPLPVSTSTSTVVITQQPRPGAPGAAPRMWSSGICDCFEDIGICCCGTFCGLCLACQVATDMGESACVPFCVPGAEIVLRTKWRTQENIQQLQPYNQFPPAGPLPVSTSTSTVVITQQPRPGAPGAAPRMWSSGICDCFEDIGICCCGTFCGLCLACQVATDMGESACVPFCVPGAEIVLRTKWRTQENIQGSILDDCGTAVCCGPCSLCQLAREVQRKRNGTLFTYA